MRTVTRRDRTMIVLIAAAAVLLAAVWAVTGNTSTTNGQPAAPAIAYSPQPERNAEWIGGRGPVLDTAATHSLATNYSYEILPKFFSDYSLAGHRQAATRLVESAKAAGNDLHVFDYFNASFWLLVNKSGWAQSAATFNSSWYLRDSSGRPIPFYGTGNSGLAGGQPVGYMLDLANPGFRTWAVDTIVSWMKAAPFSGIAFDSANPLIGDVSRPNVGSGSETFNQLLCGDVAGVSDCPRVEQWNAGLADLLNRTSTALHAMGDKVIYNGVGPSAQRGATRNVALLADADMATNEGFCFTAGGSRSTGPKFTSLVDDIQMMRSTAAQHKQLMEITNYGSLDNAKYGDYCLAGFLMGWQPGYDFMVWHEGYQLARGASPTPLPEQNLAIGQPESASYHRTGSVLTREFSHGFAAVNTSERATSIVAPAAITQFSNGSPVREYKAGQRIPLAGMSGALFLTETFLRSHSS